MDTGPIHYDPLNELVGFERQIFYLSCHPTNIFHVLGYVYFVNVIDYVSFMSYPVTNDSHNNDYNDGRWRWDGRNELSTTRGGKGLEKETD